jgi:hypothetical protein
VTVRVGTIPLTIVVIFTGPCTRVVKLLIAVKLSIEEGSVIGIDCLTVALCTFEVAANVRVFNV